MGRVRNSQQAQATHKAGPLKQTNKKHKTGRHRSKGVIDVETRGRVNSTGSISKACKHKLKRAERRKQAVANRNKKFQDVLDKKKTLGGARGASICVALIPLSNATNLKLSLRTILENSQSFASVVGQTENSTHLKLSNGKNLMFVIPANNDIWTILDTLKLCDVSMFVLPTLDSISPEGLTLLKAAKDQGLCTPFLGVTTSFSKTEEKAFLKSFARYLPVEKIYELTNPGNISNALRMVTVAKMTIPTQWSKRSSILIEDYKLEHDVDQTLIPFTPIERGSKLLKITGIVRRKNLDPHRPVYISGCGAFQILRIDVNPLETIIADRKQKMESMMDSSVTLSPSPAVPPRFVLNPVLAPEEIIEEQTETLNNEDAMNSGSDIDDDDYDNSDGESDNTVDMDDNSGVKSNKKRLPKGTSDYQADWLDNSDEDGSVIGSDDELESEGEKDESEEEEDDDMDLDMEEEQKQMLVAKAARTEAEFPDWIDTPMDVAAKIRFQRYRGLQSFKNSPWDVNENLPKEYSKVFQFQNFRHSYKLIAGDKATDDGVGFIPVGQRITILMKPMDESCDVMLSKAVGSSKLVSLISLLRHETRMSVLNLQLHVSEIVKNKEELIFQVGFHRFQAKPILSEISPGNKHKMLRYAQVNMSCMMTLFGPIVFPVTSVLAFKSCNSTLIPIGYGSLFSIDPARIITKRVLLSGYPFKVHGKSATIRFMFFNREDIDWFKPVELKTRYGRRGHIKEPLGTHGHMKCVFDGAMKSQDTVLMPLYKRVFPKWNYEENVSPFFLYDQQYLNH